MASKRRTGARVGLLLLAGALTSSAWLMAGESGERETLASARVSRCTPVEVRAVHGGELPANARLARIENGKVPCMHVEEMTIASCEFSTSSEALSGKWLEGPEGQFALVGQAVSRDGKPGGDWIVAARVEGGESAYCSEPTGMDTAGRVSPGVELANICVIEDVLQQWNAMSIYGSGTLVNVATMEVCSLNNPATRPHPDGAELVRSYSSNGGDVDDIFCYTGWGAGLNDINGTERDETTNYLTGERYCHWIVSSGFEVPGAKRPATKSLPAPGIVNVKSLVVWRPVNPNVNIAN